MPNVQAVQILEDGPVNTAVKFTGTMDGVDAEPYNIKLLPATFNTDFGLVYNQPETWRVDYIEYSLSDGLQGILYWDVNQTVADSVIMLPVAGRSNKTFKNFGGLQNNARGLPGYTGGIGLQVGYTEELSGTGITIVYSIILDLTKQGPNLS